MKSYEIDDGLQPVKPINKAETLLLEFFTAEHAPFDDPEKPDWGHISGTDMIESVGGLLVDIRKHFADAGPRQNVIDGAQGVVADLVDQYHLVRDAYEKTQPILVHRIGDKIDEILAELEELREAGQE